MAQRPQQRSHTNFVCLEIRIAGRSFQNQLLLSYANITELALGSFSPEGDFVLEGFRHVGWTATITDVFEYGSRTAPTLLQGGDVSRSFQGDDGTTYETSFTDWTWISVSTEIFFRSASRGINSVDFDFLSPTQKYLAPASNLYLGGDGVDFVTLPDQILIPGTGLTWDPLKTFEGGRGDDAIDGGSLNDTIDGGEGDDRLDGGRGVNTLLGGNGNDVIRGDQGTFDFVDGGNGIDTIVLPQFLDADFDLDKGPGGFTITYNVGEDQNNHIIFCTNVEKIEFANATIDVSTFVEKPLPLTSRLYSGGEMSALAHFASAAYRLQPSLELVGLNINQPEDLANLYSYNWLSDKVDWLTSADLALQVQRSGSVVNSTFEQDKDFPWTGIGAGTSFQTMRQHWLVEQWIRCLLPFVALMMKVSFRPTH